MGGDVFVTGYGYTETDVLAFAESLRPPTEQEWATMLLNFDQQISDTEFATVTVPTESTTPE